jgi:2-methylcitrate dehydratase
VFEGNKGFCEVVSGDFAIDWRREDLERVTLTSLKRYDAEVHAQSAVEATIEIALEHPFSPRTVRRIMVDVFDVAHRIIGGGEEGEKMQVRNKEEADHSLPYMIAAALIDRGLGPAQYTPERIARPDVQSLLRRVVVLPNADMSRRFPREHACRVRVELEDGRVLEKSKNDYYGFFRRPWSWEMVREKFDALTAARLAPPEQARLACAVADLDRLETSDLCALLASEGSR